jgi:hypothetical protein
MGRSERLHAESGEAHLALSAHVPVFPWIFSGIQPCVESLSDIDTTAGTIGGISCLTFT